MKLLKKKNRASLIVCNSPILNDVGQEYHHFASYRNLNEPQKKQFDSVVVSNDVNDRPDSATRKSVENAIRFNLVPVRRNYTFR